MPKRKYCRYPALALIAVFASALPHAHAEVYRCTENGKVVFSDRVCGDTAEAINVNPASGEQPAARVSRTPQDVPSSYPRRLQKRVKNPYWESGSSSGAVAPAAPAPAFAPYAANNKKNYSIEEAQQQQGRLIECIADAYNAWGNRKPRPSAEQMSSQLSVIQKMCRLRFPGAISNR